jgi:hypothetical protein
MKLLSLWLHLSTWLIFNKSLIFFSFFSYFSCSFLSYLLLYTDSAVFSLSFRYSTNCYSKGFNSFVKYWIFLIAFFTKPDYCLGSSLPIALSLFACSFLRGTATIPGGIRQTIAMNKTGKPYWISCITGMYIAKNSLIIKPWLSQAGVIVSQTAYAAIGIIIIIIIMMESLVYRWAKRDTRPKGQRQHLGS